MPPSPTFPLLLKIMSCVKLGTLPHTFRGEGGECGPVQDFWVLLPAPPLPGVKDVTQGKEEDF